MNERTPVMEGRHITVRFGPGCPYCQKHTDLEKGALPRVPHHLGRAGCELSAVPPGRFWELWGNPVREKAPC